MHNPHSAGPPGVPPPFNIRDLDPARPVLIAGPTASGKSALALDIAAAQGRAVVNADALQVFAGWPVLTAQPDAADRARAPHHLYGHVPADGSYSVGRWLADVDPLLDLHPAPVIVGGTGLYLSALTEGLAEIPPTDPAVRAEADARMAAAGRAALLADLDPVTRARIDPLNPARVQRAWEVQRQTGRGIAHWQDDTGPPRLPPGRAHLIQIAAPPAVLNPRIAARFDVMLARGALNEARAMEPRWNPALQSARAIGAADLIAVIRGQTDIASATEAAIIATRQYAKRQRTWFRRRMAAWPALPVPGTGLHAVPADLR
jgi:tRNA dimethylallyltransferase